MSQRSGVLRDSSVHNTADKEVWEGAASRNMGYPFGHHGAIAAAAAGQCAASLGALSVLKPRHKCFSKVVCLNALVIFKAEGGFSAILSTLLLNGVSVPVENCGNCW